MDQVVKGRCLSSQAALPPSGLSRQEASQAKPAAANAVRIEEAQRLIRLCECGADAGQAIILADVATFLSAEAKVYEFIHASAFIDAAAAMLVTPAIWRRYTDESCSVYAASPYGGPAQVRHDGNNRIPSLALAAANLRMHLAPLLKAQAIEARRAATGTGAVHESAVPQGCAHPGAGQ